MRSAWLRSTGAFLVVSLFSSWLGAKPPDVYPHMADNLATSAHYALRKVLNGQVDGMFALPGSHQMVAVAGRYLWKFNAQGELVDSLIAPDHLHTSGMVFTPQYYMDWVYTGDKQPKTYAPAVDGNKLSDTALFAELDRAEHLEFGKSDTAAWAYLLVNGKAWMLDISNKRDKVDTYCRRRTHSAEKLGWDATCFDGYKPTPRAKSLNWTELEPESFGPYANPEMHLEVVAFDKRRYHLEEGVAGQLFGLTIGAALKAAGVPGGLPERYWFGDAHSQLRVGTEVLKFKAFSSLEKGQYHFSNMGWWDAPAVQPGSNPWITVSMRTYMERSGEMGLLPHYEKDIGLYVVRSKSPTAAVPTTTAAVAAWHPVFEGPDTRTAVAADVTLAPTQAPAYRWLRKPAVNKRMVEGGPKVEVQPLQTDLQQLPTALAVEWTETYRSGRTLLRITLAPAETQAAFASLAQSKQPVELVVQVPNLRGPVAGMAVLLRSGNTRVALSQARMERLIGPAPAEDIDVSEFSPIPTPAANKSPGLQLQDAIRGAKKAPTAQLPVFLALAQHFVSDPARAEAQAPSITAAYAELLNYYNVGSDSQAHSAKLVRHYLAEVYPRTGAFVQNESTAYNVGVIASQSLAFALNTPGNQDIVDGVMARLIGPGFNPQKQTNGTLLYNLACYYARRADKPHMLTSVAAARRLNKHTDQFMRDTDFQPYWKDADFLAAVATPPVPPVSTP